MEPQNQETCDVTSVSAKEAIVQEPCEEENHPCSNPEPKVDEELPEEGKPKRKEKAMKTKKAAQAKKAVIIERPCEEDNQQSSHPEQEIEVEKEQPEEPVQKKLKEKEKTKKAAARKKRGSTRPNAPARQDFKENSMLRLDAPPPEDASPAKEDMREAKRPSKRTHSLLQDLEPSDV
jgi:hypothetical protein